MSGQAKTPLQAIRVRCLDCAENAAEVRRCDIRECPINHLRMGKGGGSTLRPIRQYCLWCCDGSANEVKLCPAMKCPLHALRFGRRVGACSDLQREALRKARCAVNQPVHRASGEEQVACGATVDSGKTRVRTRREKGAGVTPL
jgi:hypothetical protein